MNKSMKSLPTPSPPEMRQIDPAQFIGYFMNKAVKVENKNTTVQGTIIQFGGGMMVVEKLDGTRKLLFLTHVISIEEIRPGNARMQ